METKNKINYTKVLLVILFMLVIVLNVVMYRKGFYKANVESIMYKEDNSINYKVYLKKNNFFDVPYLEEDKTYITSLIDYIKVNYNYNIQFNKVVSGNYKYYILATVEANKPNNEVGNYWTKNYKLSDEKKIKIDKSTEYSINQEIKIDYNKYNKALNEFKSTLGIASTGILKVRLVVESDLDSNGLGVPVTSNLILKMPLSEKTIEASIDLDAKNNVKEITKVVETKEEKRSKLLVLGISFIVELVILAVLTIINRRNRRANMFENTVNKYLNTYDSIIVNIDKFPTLSDYNVIEVSSFEELLDAHSEVRMPINFYKYNKRTCYFILMSDKTIWKYTIKKSDFD